MTREEGTSNFEHPVALGSFRSWLKLARRSNGIDWEYVPRFLAVSLSTLLTSPLRLYESVRYGRIVERTKVHPSPVFILGHWRSGTTHLLNILCTDRQFGYVSTFQGMAPSFCLLGEKRIKPLLARQTQTHHPTRKIDNVPLSLDAPQEEALALANMSPNASLHLYSLPRQAAEIFDKYALLNNLSHEERAEWIDTYLTLLRKATLRCGGKRLILKDPANSGRIPVLLDLFPDANFIHIYRNPYHVFPSTVHMYKVILSIAQLQAIRWDRVEELVLSFYAQLMRKLLAEKSLIPAGKFVEVRYEDLEVAPMEQLRRVYESLNLPGFAEAEPAFRGYLKSVAGFQKNRYVVDEAVIAKVNRHWQFALDELGYNCLDPLAFSESGESNP